MDTEIIPALAACFRRGNEAAVRCYRPVSGTFLGLFLICALLGCGEPAADSEPARSNVDCAPGVLVKGECTTDPADCEEPGAFVDLGSSKPQHGTSLLEWHVALGPGSAVHYCYEAQDGERRVSYYGVQTGSSSVEETSLTSGDGSVACAALAVDDAGNRFVLSRRDASVLVALATQDDWLVVPLPGLSSSEAKGALQNEETVASLVPDGAGGVYVGLSLGFKVEAQPVFVAWVKGSSVEVLLDGWAEGKKEQVVGHAPRVLPGDKPLMVMGDLLAYEVVVADKALSVLDRQEGVMPLVVQTPGGGRMLFADRNGLLQIAKLVEGAIQAWVTLRLVGRSDTGTQLPWTMTSARDNGLDVLAEVQENAVRSVVHWRIDANGQVGHEQILSTKPWTRAKGGQRFANSVDMCGRTTAVILEQEDSQEPRLRLFEQR